MRVVDSGNIQMDWLCGSCQARNPGLTGSERESLKCKTCGHEKTDQDEWVMPEDIESAPYLTGEMNDRANLGPNKPCTYCGKESRANHTTCAVCGASDFEVELPILPPKAEVKLPTLLPKVEVKLPTLPPEPRMTNLLSERAQPGFRASYMLLNEGKENFFP